MKITVEVDLKSMYSEEDEKSFNEQILSDISYQVRKQIWETFKENALTSFDNQVRNKITLDKELKIKETIETFFTEKQIKKGWDGKEFVTIEEYIIKQLEDYYFKKNEFESHVQTLIKTNSDIIGKQLKERYDLQFASLIVNNLNKNNMLNENVAKVLLEDNK